MGSLRDDVRMINLHVCQHLMILVNLVYNPGFFFSIKGMSNVSLRCRYGCFFCVYLNSEPA